jgi:glycosyltransferase involved in cell wall biosynthesis
MKIAFNAQILTEPRGGTVRYIYNLLDALGQIDTSNEYHLLSSRALRQRPEIPPNLRWQIAPVGELASRRAGLEKFIWEQRAFPRAARTLQADLMHVPYFNSPIRTYGIPSVVTILDVIPQHFPEYRATLSEKAFADLAVRAAHRAAAVITISNFCKQDIIDTLGIPADRIFITHLAADPRLRPASCEAQRKLRERLGLLGPVILNVGGIDIRKNTAGLIEAFAEVYRQLGDPELRLFIVANPAQPGSTPIFPDWRPLTERLGIADKILCMSLDEADLATLYSAADCFAFTSLYEGFGLTPLEAMACGAPVICSDKTSLPEVVGDAALVVDPLDIPALTTAILRVLTSPETAQELRTRGFARARRFTWEQVARQTLDVYEETFKRSSQK